MKKMFAIPMWICTGVLLFAMTSIGYAADKIVWSAPSVGGAPDNYRVLWSQVDDTGAAQEFSKDIGNVLEYPLDTDMNLDFGVPYSISVQPTNAAGPGPRSQPVAYTRLAGTMDPENPKPDTVLRTPGQITIIIQQMPE